MKSEIQHRAKFDYIRYAQCWEDADVLIAAMQPLGRHCVSIGSAGDNSFSLLAAGALSVNVVEMNPAQIACIELRRAAYLVLEHQEFLELLGSRPSADRWLIYQKCRAIMHPTSREFWDTRADLVRSGIGAAGKFENYFRLFRERILPLAHHRERVRVLLQAKTKQERTDFYRSQWNNLRWRMIFRVFFSRFVMGRMGRDPEFFQYVDGSVADRILSRTRHALVELDASANPYLHWILTGTHGDALPHALRKESFDAIKIALGKPESFRVINAPLEGFLDFDDAKYDAFNLSDIFEYMSATSTEDLMRAIVKKSNRGARLAYWNMLVPRNRPDSMSSQLQSLKEESAQLLHDDKAWFYSRFIVEEVIT